MGHQQKRALQCRLVACGDGARGGRGGQCAENNHLLLPNTIQITQDLSQRDHGVDFFYTNVFLEIFAFCTTLYVFCIWCCKRFKSVSADIFQKKRYGSRTSRARRNGLGVRGKQNLLDRPSVHPNELLIPKHISAIQYNTPPDLQPNVLLPYSCVLFKWNRSSRATTQAFRVDDISTIHVAVFAHRGKKCDINVWKNSIQNRSSCSN